MFFAPIAIMGDIFRRWSRILLSTCTGSTRHSTGGIFYSASTKQVKRPELLTNIVLQILLVQVNSILHCVFTQLIWENKLENENLRKYMFRQPSPPSNNYYKQKLNKDQRHKIENNPLCDRFDVPLYCELLLMTAAYNSTLCSNISLRDELVNKLKELKPIRNDLAHNLLQVSGSDISNYLTNVERIMVEFLEIIGNNFGCKGETDSQKRIIKKHIKSQKQLIKKRNWISGNFSRLLMFSL